MFISLKPLTKKQNCALLFIDHSKAFDTVDHAILRQRLSSVGLANYLSDRTQLCTQFDGRMSGMVCPKALYLVLTYSLFI